MVTTDLRQQLSTTLSVSDAENSLDNLRINTEIKLAFAENSSDNIRRSADFMKYIHELKNWPDFDWQVKKLTLLLASVRHSQGRLLGRMEGLGFKLCTKVALQTLTDDVLKTSEIEGEKLDQSLVRSSLARRLGIDIGGLTKVDRNIDGIVELMLDATQRFDAPLTIERLYGWHAALFPTGRSGMSKIRVGKWRDDQDGPMQVVSGPIGRAKIHFEAPSADRLSKEVKKFLTWFNQKDATDPVIRAGIAHLWFVTLHPFEDGNGRIARAIADMTLARSENSPQRFYSMSAQICHERKDYYDILETTQRGALDITSWLTWFLECMGRAIKSAEKSLENVLSKSQFWEHHDSEIFNERQRKVLNRILDGFDAKLTSSKWSTLAKCSQDTASRDIEDLVKRGILIKNPGGGRSTSYALKVP